MLPPEIIKELLRTMFTGWIIREASWDPATSTYGKNEVEAMIEACDGNETLGYLIHLFDHWGNDIMDVAPRYGIEFYRDPVDNRPIIREVPIETGPLFVSWDGDYDSGVEKEI